MVLRVTLHDVLFAPDIIYALILVTQARCKNYHVLINVSPKNYKRVFMKISHKLTDKIIIVELEPDNKLYKTS